jgi:NADH:ubiquinone oxidoreductase subunit 6 (subunit J)
MDPKQTAETFNTLQPVLFWLLAGVTSVCAIATVVTQNIVRSATWLLFTLAGTSGIFFLLGADLVGATQLLVYVGGTLILVVFGVMLTAQGPFISMKTSGAEWAISVVAGLLLLGVLATQAVIPEGSIGAPKVVGVVSVPDPEQPNVILKRLMLTTPEVDRYAPESSRAQRQAKAGKAARSLPPLPSPDAGGPGKGAGKGPGKGPPGPQKKGKPQNDGAPPEGAPPEGAPPGGAPPGGAPPEGVLPLPQRKGPDTTSVAPVDPATSPQSAVLGQGILGVGVGPAHRDGDSRRLIRTSYLLPFELVSIHLLVVLIGAAYLARAKRRSQGEPGASATGGSA